MNLRKGMALGLALLLALGLWALTRRGKGGKTLQKMTELLGLGRFLAVVLLLVLGLFFRFGLTGHRYLAYALWAAALVILWFFALGRMQPAWPRLSRVLRGVTVGALTAFLLAFAVTEAVLITAARGAEDPEAEYLVVLGAGVNGTVASRSLTDRLNVAQSYLETYPESVAILSGAQGEHEDITEAECMYRWLSARGVAPERLLKEEAATRTINNLEYSLDIIRQREGERPVRVAVVSSEYHVYRTVLLARRLGMEILPVAAPTGILTLRISNYIRECLGVWYYLLFDR